MKSEIIKKIVGIHGFDEVIKKILQLNHDTNTVLCSPLYGVCKSLFILRLIKIENQIVLLLPNSKIAEEIFIELTLLGIEEQSVLLTDFTQESVQEKLTKILQMKKFVLISTYEMLKLKLLKKSESRKPQQSSGQAITLAIMNCLSILI